MGALILSVTAGGPAAAAGLLPGDVVTAVGSTALDADHPFDPTVLGLAPGAAGDADRLPERDIEDRPADRRKRLMRPRRHTGL